MDVFGNSTKMRGCFTKITFGANFKGFALTLPSVASGSNSVPPIVTGVSFIEAERILLVPCFNNITHTYGFGHDANRSVITVNFMSFLINQKGTDQSNIIAFMAGTYAANRLSASTKQASLYCGQGTPLNGFLVSLESSTASQEANIQGFQMQLVVVEPQCAAAPKGGSAGSSGASGSSGSSGSAGSTSLGGSLASNSNGGSGGSSKKMTSLVGNNFMASGSLANTTSMIKSGFQSLKQW